MKKLSFFERLTGTIRMEEDHDHEIFEDQDTQEYDSEQKKPIGGLKKISPLSQEEDTFAEDLADDAEAELAVDVFQNEREIVIQTMTAGIKKEHLEIILSREEITIRGKRDNPNDNYHNEFSIQELYWGPFARTIDLPDEVAIDEASATEHHGLLTIKLPKFNKDRSVRLKAQ
jgi:HSP20 family molecular chaperone IbpA